MKYWIRPYILMIMLSRFTTPFSTIHRTSLAIFRQASSKQTKRTLGNLSLFTETPLKTSRRVLVIASRIISQSQLSINNKIIQSAQFSTFQDDDVVVQEPSSNSGFEKGDAVQVEIVSFGPMGASVDILAKSHNSDDVISMDEPVLGTGLILQSEIQYFRQGRGNVDVVLGEIIPAYVERIREDEETGIVKLDICLRKFGGKAKAESLSALIMEKLEMTSGGTIPIGDKSPPELISKEFPGVSKGSFKKAVAALYKQGKVKPGPKSISLM